VPAVLFSSPRSRPSWAPACGRDESNGWTPERLAARAELIRTRKQWQQVPGPRTPDSQAKASRNAYQGGLWLRLRELSRLINAEAREARDLERLLLKRWFEAGTPIH